MTLDLSRMDAMAQAELVASGSLSALELVDAAIARIESLEPKVHALASADFDAARARARSAPSGAFGGVPILVKDLLAVPGQRWEMGSRLFRGNVATEGSPFSARLEAAGFVLLGKTTTSEFGLLGSTETRVAVVTRNPRDLERSATGSSGGSAAAVAAGMVPLAHASDGGGSIRIPASACGVFGLKPSRGRCVPAGPSDMNGLLIEHAVSRTVRDSARMLSLLEHADGPLAPVGFVSGPSSRRLRIGYYATTLMGSAPDAGASSVLERTVALCRALGHELVAAEPPPIDGQAISDGFFTLAGSGIAQIAAMMGGLLGRPPGDAELEPFTLALLDWYRGLPQENLPAAIASLEQQGNAMRRYLDTYDVVLCPTMPMEPPRLGFLAPDLDRQVLLRRTEWLAGYTPIHNVAGVPAMSVPLFRTESGLPIGSHFAAPVGQEARLLAFAYELEAAAPWVDTYPRL